MHDEPGDRGLVLRGEAEPENTNRGAMCTRTARRGNAEALFSLSSFVLLLFVLLLFSLAL